MLTYIFKARQVQAYVDTADKENGTRRLFFSTTFLIQWQIFRVWQEKAPQVAVCSISLCFYSFRWNIEVSFYEQKTLWSLCGYMVCSLKGIEMMVNLINISYCAMKLLPFKKEIFSMQLSLDFGRINQYHKNISFIFFLNWSCKTVLECYTGV